MILRDRPLMTVEGVDLRDGVDGSVYVFLMGEKRKGIRFQKWLILRIAIMDGPYFRQIISLP